MEDFVRAELLDEEPLLHLSAEEFQGLVALFTPHRAEIERHLRSYRERGGEGFYGSWCEYVQVVMWDVVPAEVWDAAAAYLSEVREGVTS